MNDQHTTPAPNDIASRLRRACAPATPKVDIDAQLVRDAMRYRAIKEKIDYSNRGGMTWAILDWCVDVHSLSPSDLDEAIDQILLAKTG